jgi:hypothetical protein
MPSRLFHGALIWFLLLPTTPQESPQAPPLEGLWLSDGYGLLIEIKPGGLQTYQLTSISCISADRQRGATTLRKIPVSHSYRQRDITFTDCGSDTATMHTDGVASDIILHRSLTRPEACGRDRSVLLRNYRVWQTFAGISFFSLHRVDWQAIDTKFGPELPRPLRQHGYSKSSDR